MNLLHLDSSILAGNSVSRTLSSATTEHLIKANPQLRVTYRDLAATPIPHLSGAYLAAGATPDAERDGALASDLAIGSQVLQEFLDADVVVIGVAFYNFTISTQLKAWIDRIAVAGKTFSYSEKGPQGLCAGKRVILTISRGGFYGAGTPFEALEHAESYLKAVFAFLGVTNIEVVAAEGVNLGPDQREKSLSAALGAVNELRAA